MDTNFINPIIHKKTELITQSMDTSSNMLVNNRLINTICDKKHTKKSQKVGKGQPTINNQSNYNNKHYNMKG
jgi:hypothetical protein